MTKAWTPHGRMKHWERLATKMERGKVYTTNQLAELLDVSFVVAQQAADAAYVHRLIERNNLRYSGQGARRYYWLV